MLFTSSLPAARTIQLARRTRVRERVKPQDDIFYVLGIRPRFPSRGFPNARIFQEATDGLAKDCVLPCRRDQINTMFDMELSRRMCTGHRWDYRWSQSILNACMTDQTVSRLQITAFHCYEDLSFSDITHFPWTEPNALQWGAYLKSVRFSFCPCIAASHKYTCGPSITHWVLTIQAFFSFSNFVRTQYQKETLEFGDNPIGYNYCYGSINPARLAHSNNKSRLHLISQKFMPQCLQDRLSNDMETGLMKQWQGGSYS